MRSLLSFIFAATIFVLLAGGADAADRRLCRDFKDLVAKMAAANKSVGDGGQQCGYTTDLNYLNPDAQAGWCAGSKNDTVNAEIARRNREVTACNACRTYASEARKMAHKNATWGCGQSGDAWTDDEQAHFQWCMNEHIANAMGGDEDLARFVAFRDGETKNREKRMNQCSLAAEDASVCKNYALRMVRQSQLLRACNKNFVGDPNIFGVWSDDFDVHFGLCRQKMIEAHGGWSAQFQEHLMVNNVRLTFANLINKRDQLIQKLCGTFPAPDPAAGIAPEKYAGCLASDGAPIPCSQALVVDGKILKKITETDRLKANIKPAQLRLQRPMSDADRLKANMSPDPTRLKDQLGGGVSKTKTLTVSPNATSKLRKGKDAGGGASLVKSDGGKDAGSTVRKRAATAKGGGSNQVKSDTPSKAMDRLEGSSSFTTSGASATSSPSSGRASGAAAGGSRTGSPSSGGASSGSTAPAMGGGFNTSRPGP